MVDNRSPWSILLFSVTKYFPCLVYPIPVFFLCLVMVYSYVMAANRGAAPSGRTPACITPARPAIGQSPRCPGFRPPLTGIVCLHDFPKKNTIVNRLPWPDRTVPTRLLSCPPWKSSFFLSSSSFSSPSLLPFFLYPAPAHFSLSVPQEVSSLSFEVVLFPSSFHSFWLLLHYYYRFIFSTF